jgi:hypothetical protein
VPGDEAHPLVHESGDAFDMLDLAVRAQAVNLIEDIYFNRFKGWFGGVAAHK